jgi:hypothetical protein
VTTIGITCNEPAGSCLAFDLSRRSIAKAETLAPDRSTCYNLPMSKLELIPHKSVHNPGFARRNMVADFLQKRQLLNA